MNLILNYWKRRWQSVAFNPATGSGHIRWLARKPKKGGGWALKYNQRWYAVWRADENLVFQAGTTLWPLTNEYQCSNVLYGSSRKFSISKSGVVVFELMYEAYDGNADPTFDNLDLELIDFFYWLTVVWNDAGLRASLKEAWINSDISKIDGVSLT